MLSDTRTMFGPIEFARNCGVCSVFLVGARFVFALMASPARYEMAFIVYRVEFACVHSIVRHGAAHIDGLLSEEDVER
jgi:hypothetical protein